MIVVVGQPGDRDALGIAMGAARAGGRVQLVSRVADDRAGDRTILALAEVGVGHVATLRQPPPASALDPADLDLALRYLDDVGVLVLCGPDDALSRTAAAGAAWSHARVVVTLADGSAVPAGLPDDAIVVAAPATDPDGAFRAVIADLAVRLDTGEDPRAAFAATMAGQPAWTPTAGDGAPSVEGGSE